MPHQVNDTSGIQAGCSIVHVVPSSGASEFQSVMCSWPTITVASRPSVIASMLPASEPRRRVSMPTRKTPSIGPRMKPAMPSTTGMMRRSGVVTLAWAKAPAMTTMSAAKSAVNARAACT